MEIEVLNLSTSCRLCLAPTTRRDAKDMYAEAQLIEMVESIFSISFQQTEWCPRKICKDCQALVTKIYDYVQKVRTNQDYLQSINLKQESQSTEKTALDEAVSDNEIKDEPIIEDVKPLEITLEEDDDQQLESSTEDVGVEQLENNVSDVDEEVLPKKRRKRKVKKIKSVPENREQEEELIKRYFTFRCDICTKESPNFKALSDHFREAHNTSGYVKCCNKKLYRRCRLLDHISKHENPDSFRCDICNKTYACRTSLELHNMHIHLSENEKPHKCSICAKSFAKDYQLKCHMVRHVSVECQECGKTMSNRLSLRDHMINLHGGVGQPRLCVCDTCGKEFRSKPAFEKHVLLHQGIVQDNSIQCHLCPRWLTNKMGLQRHIRTQHSETGDTFVCGDCGKIAPNSSALKQHRRVVHAEMKYECEICGKRFKRAISLKEHRAIHTGEALYSCRFCPMTFISNANMYSHQKKMHPDEWQKSQAEKLKK
nr:transcription factor grauzone-like [Aedes albopictus]